MGLTEKNVIEGLNKTFLETLRFKWNILKVLSFKGSIQAYLKLLRFKR